MGRRLVVVNISDAKYVQLSYIYDTRELIKSLNNTFQYRRTVVRFGSVTPTLVTWPYWT